MDSAITFGEIVCRLAGVVSGQRRHNARVDDAQILHTVHAKLLIYDTAHLSRHHSDEVMVVTSGFTLCFLT
jgi:hypothetical protein